MSASATAEHHLRAIRALMERATIYRALSAPAALTGGTLSILCAGALMRGGQTSWEFAIAWFAVFLVTVAMSGFLLCKDARRRGQQFLSPAARSAGLAMLPALAAGGVLSAVAVVRDGTAVDLPGTWLFCYALALLATGHFAPRSIRRLGWAFLAAALVVLTDLHGIAFDALAPKLDAPARANVTMAVTFGMLHLAYAAFTWSRRSNQADLVTEA
ncbi:MAG TPA: hypothetical protein VFV83_09585 [Chthoniobacteraceae bacterium]|nr:hypothetical protein [Chthoniobacteraceae bacterium]